VNNKGFRGPPFLCFIIKEKKKRQVDFQAVKYPTIGNNFELFWRKGKKKYIKIGGIYSLSISMGKKNGSHLPLLSDSAFTFSQVIAVIIYDYKSMHPNDRELRTDTENNKLLYVSHLLPFLLSY